MSPSGLRCCQSAAGRWPRPGPGAQRLPEPGRDDFLQCGVVFGDALGTAGARDHRSHCRVGQRELQRGRLDADAVLGRDGLDALDLGQDLRRRLLVLEVAATGQHAGAVRTADHDAGVALGRLGHHPLQRTLVVEQRVAACQQEAIRTGFVQVQGQLDRLDTVDAQAPGLDHALLAQAGQHLEGTAACGLEVRQPLIAIEVLCDVVHPDDIQAIGLQALEAVVDRTQGGIGRVVVDQLVGAAGDEQAALLAKVAGAGVFHFVQDQAADLGAEHEVIAVALGQRVAKADLGQACAIERGGIEVAGALFPGRVHRGLGLGFRMSRNMLPSGAVPKPRVLPASSVLMLMDSPLGRLLKLRHRLGLPDKTVQDII